MFARIGAVNHAYNRTVIYAGNLLHCSMTRDDVYHTDDAEKGRLTIAAFMLAR